MALPPCADQHLTLQVRNSALLLLPGLLLQMAIVLSDSWQPDVAGAGINQGLTDYQWWATANLTLHCLLLIVAAALAWRCAPIALPRTLLCAGYLSFICCSVMVWPYDICTQHFLLLGAMICGFLFHRTEYRRQRLWTLVYGVAFVVIEVALVYPLQDWQQWARLSNSLLLTLTAFAVVFALGQMNIRRWQQVRTAYAKTRAAMQQMVPDDPLPAVLACQTGERVRLPCVCVLFADLAGFQKMSNQLDDDTMVSILDALYREFDLLAYQAGVTRLKTNGDEYMAATGLTRRSPQAIRLQCESISQFSQALLRGFQSVAAQLSLPCHIRIGIACGPVTAGIIGRQRPALDIWGRTVNFASELEHAACHDSILVDASVQTNLTACTRYTLIPRTINTKLGPADAWQLSPIHPQN